MSQSVLNKYYADSLLSRPALMQLQTTTDYNNEDDNEKKIINEKKSTPLNKPKPSNKN